MDTAKARTEPDADVSGIDHGAPIRVQWRLSGLQTGLGLLAATTGLFLIWQMSSSLLLIFAGVLFAAFLDGCARALRPVIPAGHTWRLALIVLILTSLLVLSLVWGAGKLPEQTRLLYQVMNAQLDVLQQHLQSVGVDLFGPEGGRDFSQWLPDRGKLFGHAQTAVGTTTGFLASTLIIMFLGILFAFNPAMYRDGFITFVKIPYRARVREVMDEMGSVLCYWLIGQVFRIVLMTLVVWPMLYLLGVPGAFLLGLQAGLSNFVPYLGPIVAAFPIALVAMPLGVSKVVWAVGLYTIIQSIEGYIIGPLIQRHAVDVPPAWTLVAIVLFGSLFGVMGIALAMPLLALGRIAVLRLYVEDCLGDKID